MQIFQDLGGFSLGEADLVRRAMGKKDKKTLMAQKEKFINGGVSDINGSKIVGCVYNFRRNRKQDFRRYGRVCFLCV